MDLVNYIDLGMTYSFNKNLSTYVDYKINMLDNDELSMKQTASLPMTSWVSVWFTSSNPSKIPKPASAGFFVSRFSD
jgi:predicted porin